ncbi:lysophospholipase L1-like esterase [Paenibacillus phyllosphaerae]|uniref:Lysophospholipase L1-like esterase n=1 Tax=Paenibacillus phyllosphaerae TaxID=274593 RepID=A0A7W5AU27_9BACL|nr:stalk domain-containing protein [Paenibacillus phyllosphaerae]MBB3108579.1 lysophospholipase L1-like esterase [Paenibacillus phyllosphaerae]
MYSNFRKNQLALLAAAAVLVTCAVPAASAQGSAPQTSASAATYTFAGVGTGANAPQSAVPLAAPLLTQNESSANNPLQVVALGDSLTVGYTLGMTADATPYGYADRLYEQALYHGAAELTNFGVLGLKSNGLAAWLEAAAQGKAITAEEAQSGLSKYATTAGRIEQTTQLKDALTGADLITMTIGGNDFLPLFNEIRSREVTPEELTKLLADLVDAYKAALTASLDTIYTLNPDVTIVLADQYLPVPKPNQIIQAVTEEQYAVLQQGVADLHDELIALQSDYAAKGSNLSIVDISTPFAGKEFLLTSIREGDVHPNNSGYKIIAQQFADTIWGAYREASTLPAGVPLHIVVGGKELTGGNKPVVKNNTTFLPMRDVANALGASVTWDSKTQTATLKSEGKVVSFTIGAKTMKVNGQTLPLTTPAYLEKTGKTTSSTYLPLAALSKGLGYQVTYRKPIQTVFINE